MYNSHPSRITALVSLTAALIATPPCATSAEQNKAACKPTHISNKVTSLVDCNVITDPNDPETSTRRFITDHAQDLNLPADHFQLKLLGRKKTLHGQYSRLQQIINGYPVHNATLSIRQDKTGHIRRVHSQDNTQQQATNAKQKQSLAVKAIISQNQAEQIALQALKKAAVGTTDLKISQQAQKIWYPNPDGSMSLAWKMLITGENPLGDFLLMIDAANGNILLQQNRIKFFQRGQGWVFQPNPVQTTGITSLTDQDNAISPLLTSQLINVTLRGLIESQSANFLLKGQFVDVASLNNPDYPHPNARQTNRKYFYNRNDPRFEQVMVYHTIDTYQRYLQALGFNNSNPAPNGIHQFPIRANAHEYSNDLSFYRPTNDTLHFGDGGVDDAEDADIILHEYGHAIQEAQNPDWGCAINDYCEMLAMGEGFSDYIAADFHAHQGNPSYQSQHAACVGEWDGTAYSNTTPTCLRRVDSNKIYPKDLAAVTDDVTERDKMYLDSAIWSRALWDIRKALGSNIANQIIFEHHYGLPADATMPMAALEMLSVDAESFGGVHELALRKAFCTRGVLRNTQCVPPKNKTTIVYASKDSSISQAYANNNNGGHERLQIGGTSTLANETRTVLGFDLGTVDIKKIKAAVLELTLANSDSQWGTFGRTLDIHPLWIDFSEGQKGSAYPDVWPWIIFKNKPGVTWNCPVDKQVINNSADCPAHWSGGIGNLKKFAQNTSVPVIQTNGMAGKVRWAITDDIKAGVRHWLIKKTFPEPGRVEYYSKEGAQKKHDKTLSPRLIITLK